MFSAKEMDEETGLYYYGARYLDPKYSRWLSTDPALGEYMSGSKAGMGGIYNSVNFNLYHYAGNNPLKYVDPDGREDWDANGTSCTITPKDTLWKITDNFNNEHGTNISCVDAAKANGIENPDLIFAGNSLDFSSFLNINSSNNVNSNVTDNSDGGYYSKAGNFFLGFGELISGVGIIVGGGFAAAALAPETMGGSAMVGYDAVLTGGAISAYGITRMAGANNKPFGEDLKNILVPPMAAFADVDSRKMKK